MTDATLVYDDDCGFCTWWADLIANHADVRLVGFSNLSATLRERLPDDYRDCVHLVTEDDVYSCGAAVEEAIVRSDFGTEMRPVVDFLRQFEDYERLRERAYRWGADNRDTLGMIVSETPPAKREAGGDAANDDAANEGAE